MDNTNGILATIGAVVTPLFGAIAYLYKELRKAPRPEDHAKLVDDCEKMRLIIDHAAEETKQQRAELAERNRTLEAKLARLEASIARRTRSADEPTG